MDDIGKRPDSFPLDVEPVRFARVDRFPFLIFFVADREQSGFLLPSDSSGREADFHSLRHGFITYLVTAKVPPKVAQRLARHSTITLTMDRYTHLGITDLAGALQRLPTLPATTTLDSKVS